MTQPADAAAEHWADAIASEVAARSERPVISTGISPSGEIHVGNMREVLTADAVGRALADRGVDRDFHFIADDLDPLRRVYPFLDRDRYEPLVGRALAEIPCPCGEHRSYAEHFLEPFLRSLNRLKVEVEVIRAHELYGSGRMNGRIVEALENRDRIAAILQELTGKRMVDEWSPFTARCGACGSMSTTVVRGFSAADETVDYRCGCGESGTVPMAGGGKLVWRIDWPARWRTLGVTVEPFGKDHSTRGGSYDTGVRIAREVFGIEPPFPVPYEWIRLKGAGDMSSSRGNVLSVAKVLEVAPPEALRYLVMKEKPQKTIAFDPGRPLLQLVDQIDDATARGRNERAVELSRAAGFRPVGVSFKHLVVVAQAARFDSDTVLQVLARTGYPGLDRQAVTERLAYARRWLETFAPEDDRFEVQERLPEAASTLTDGQREFLAELAERLRADMDGSDIHNLIYELAGRREGTPPATLFAAIYLVLLGKPRGPRAGAFLAVLGPEFCARRFREASGGIR